MVHLEKRKHKLTDGSEVLIIEASGDLDDDAGSIRLMDDWVVSSFNGGVKYVVMNFSKVPYINDHMGMLVKWVDKFQEVGGDFLLVKVPEKMIALFDMLDLLSLFKIFETEKDALEFIESNKH